jgi:hypothetical protein
MKRTEQRTCAILGAIRDARINRDKVEAGDRSHHHASAKMPLSSSRSAAIRFRNAPRHFASSTSPAFLD